MPGTKQDELLNHLKQAQEITVKGLTDEVARLGAEVARLQGERGLLYQDGYRAGFAEGQARALSGILTAESAQIAGKVQAVREIGRRVDEAIDTMREAVARIREDVGRELEQYTQPLPEGVALPPDHLH